MCLSVPMKIEAIEGLKARCTALGEERWVDLSLMADAPPREGEYVIVQLHYAQRTVPEADALESYKLFGEILDHLDGTANGSS